MARFNNDAIDAVDYFLETVRKTGNTDLLKPQPILVNVDGGPYKSYIDEFVPAKLPKITKVVANEKNGYTIVKFSNNYVAKVKCNNEDFDLEKAVAMAITKYLIGNNNFYKALENATVIKKEEK